MAKVSIIDIENAFDFVNFDNLSDNEAAVDRETGEIYFWSSDLEEELPDDFDIESESLVLLPDKRDLDLGSKLAIDFAREFCPDDFEEIIAIFSHPGAYAHFKRLLERKNRL